MSGVSNTLHVVLPPGMDLRAATAAFGKFGDVSRVEVLPSAPPAAIVSYFDARAAVRAARVLGAEWCWPGEQCGDRTAPLPGSVQLSRDQYSRVSSVRRDPAGDGFVVEFYDVRDAARVRAASKAQAPPAPVAKAAKAPARSSKLEPAYVGAGDDTRELSLLVQGLPKAMCSRVCFDVILEQAGLAEHVLSHSVRPGSRCGEAVLKVAGEEAASKCIEHFHGRAWDPSGTLVSATRLAPPPGLSSATKEASPPNLQPAAKSPLLPILQEGAEEPTFLAPPGLDGVWGTKDADSEESTDAGASEMGECHDECSVDRCSIVVA